MFYLKKSFHSVRRFCENFGKISEVLEKVICLNDINNKSIFLALNIEI